MPKISVIVPVHNDFKYLPQTLASIATQTLQDFEIIIVDDCSKHPEKAVTIANKFICDFPAMSGRVQVIRHPVNRGVSAARNTGIAQSTGEYLCFIDSDDVFMPRKLECQSHILDKRPSAGMVYSDEYRIPEGKDRWNDLETVQFTHVGPSGMIFPDFLARSFIATFSVMVRRSAGDAVGWFDEELLNNGEDDDLWYRLMLKYEAIFSVYVSGARREREGSISGDRAKVAYYQYMSWLKIKKTMPDVFEKYRAIFVERTKKRMKSYLKYCLKTPRIPQLKIFRQYLELID